ncbi:nuclear transport factor 2 family protein [Bradyrhizobium sp.]|uniref:nuclear transport factor 2 family protein n=1 Tax=Bradyrhizobium sp. TaxID=376 RepID=UPI002DDD6FB3|nr:nuclear transport factor 2 family protein [Bradyrhizobium sp.]HEV2153161.1 nuclear transport factor 2 family protein [Bradyrhizobium sp.]
MNLVPAERDILFEDFARALFKRDMDALYRVVCPDFVWRYHDGVSPELVLIGRDAILKHLDENKARYATSRFRDVVYHHLPDVSFMTFRISETVRSTGEHRELRAWGGAFFEVTVDRVATPPSLPFSSSRLSFPRARP